jgi:hypothetical protein
MNINRHNYEEFFLLYVDNELPAADRISVEEFVRQHPDLRKELELLQGFTLTPEENIVFSGKDSLLKPEGIENNINSGNYETFFVLYNDDELNNGQKAMVEEFVYRHPQYQSELELIQQVRLEADTAIVFPNKELLYRKEEDDKVIPFPWWRLAVAAMLSLIAGIWWLNNGRNKPDSFVTKGGKNPLENNRPAVSVPNERKTTNEPVNIAPKQEVANSENRVEDDRHSVKSLVKKPVNKLREKKTALAVNRRNYDPKVKEKKFKAAEGITEQEGTDRLVASKVNQTIEKNKYIAINATKPTVEERIVIDQPSGVNYTDESNKENNTYASFTSDKVEVLNTSVNRKNNIRGFLRRASRLIAKKTSLGNDDGNRKSILIGGFEIAGK